MMLVAEMAGVVVQLGPNHWGAELLVKIASGRRSGLLRSGAGGDERLTFVEGRPERLVSGAAASEDRREVAAAVRRFALRAEGSCSFEPSAEPARGKLGIDTLGEVLVALLRELPADLAASFVAARGEQRLEAAPAFAKIAGAVAGIGAAKLAPPAGVRTLSQLVGGAASEEQRAWIALAIVGGLGPAAISGARAAPAAKPSPSPAPSSSADMPVYAEIEQTFERMADQSHYDFLGVPRDAGAEVVKQAYFAHAKRWHADRFAGTTLSAESIARAQEIFRRAEEAHAVLSTSEERKSYDYVLERRSKGLPTDPKVIFEAEAVFRKAQALVRRGEAAAAEPLLRDVVAMNGGEAEFWVFLGYACHAARGRAALGEARELINKGLAMTPRLDAAHEFLGRIARVEGEVALAQKHLQMALELNPKNVDAERELRLITMRGKEAGASKERGGLGGLLDKVLRR